MFDIIKTTIELILKSLNIPELLKHRKKKEIKRIGTELFLFYTAINDIVVRGRDIIKSLKSSINKIYHIYDIRYLPGIIFVQLGNIERLLSSIRRLGIKLQLISTESYIDLFPLLTFKLGVLRQIILILTERNIPLYSFEKDIEEIQSKYKKEFYLSEFTSYEDWKKDEEKELVLNAAITELISEDLNNLFNKMKAKSILNPTSLTKEQRFKLKKYFQLYNPEKTLNEIAAIAKRLRKSIVSNFAIEDILFEVADDRSPLSLGSSLYQKGKV